MEYIYETFPQAYIGRYDVLCMYNICKSKMNPTTTTITTTTIQASKQKSEVKSTW